MGLKTRSDIRVGQTRRELERTRAEIIAWCKKWEADDKRQQFATPRRLLEEVLVRALAQLGGEIAKLPGTRPLGSVYAECARFDRNIAWVRRLWEYFALKFDQRRNVRFQPVLAAADEIVWSCYAEAFQNAAGAAPRGPAPLPYLEPLFAPHALPRVDIPPDLRSEVDRDFLSACLEQLPISLIALPTVCVDAPWWLILLGHEVGHHVQFDLIPPRQLFAAFGKFLAKAGEQEMAGEGERWKRWSPEIFADAFSVHALGPWAARGITELETKDDVTMMSEIVAEKSAYPAPWVRLNFLAAVAEQLDENDTIAREGVPAGDLPQVAPGDKAAFQRQQTERALKAAPGIAKTIVKNSVEQLGTFQKLCGWQPAYFSPGGSVDQWAQALQGDPADFMPEQTLHTPRLVISGAWAAWSQVSAIADEDKADKARKNLSENIVSFIPRCAEEGTRAAGDVQAIEPEQFSDGLVKLLLERAPEPG
jgi:hypothetical protein